MTLHSIGYLAKLHGVSTSTIRRWEAAGLIEKAKQTLGDMRPFRAPSTRRTHVNSEA